MNKRAEKVEIAGFRQNGDCSILIDFADSDTRAGLSHIHFFADQLRQNAFYDAVNIIPAKTSLMLAFPRPVQSWADLQDSLLTINSSLAQKTQATCSHYIPVCYHPDIAPDLKQVLEQTGLDLDGLIAIHSGRDYLVSMLGFLPGFMYLDELDRQLVLPRKTTPAIRLPEGSVAIAGNQSGLYSISSPGGWHVIGRTPLQLVDWANESPMIIRAMDTICFKPISLAEFRRLEKRDKL